MARTLVGTVASARSHKTIVVAVSTRKTHPVYKKQYTVTKRYAAHDEQNAANVGDVVEIVECRPLSTTKHFMMTSIIEKASVRHENEADASAVEAVTKKSKKEEGEA